MLYELQLKLDHDLPFSSLSRDFPKERIERWCNLLFDILEIECSNAEVIDAVENEIRRLARKLSAKQVRIRRYSDRSLEAIVACRCSVANSSIAMIESSDCIPIMPLTYSEGLEHIRFLAFKKRDLDNALRNLSKVSRDVNVEGKSINPRHSARSAMTISFDDFFRALTQRQLSALVAALEMGYYSLPKRITMSEIASKQGVPRSTYEEHLRKAEIKVLLALKPYARLGLASHPMNVAKLTDRSR